MIEKEIMIDDFDYKLPEELIAQSPTKKRDNCRLLFLNKKNGEIKHDVFKKIEESFSKNDVLVLNNSKVFPARLHGHKKISKGKVEVFLHKNVSDNNSEIWETMIKGKVKNGLEIVFSSGLEAEILCKNSDNLYKVKFNLKGKEFSLLINEIGETPLPPYIKRKNGLLKDDKKNYQTVFADDDKLGSSAAPTAGLHFTSEMIERLEKKGVEIIFVTLHVGLGTFAPVKSQNMLNHKMHKEEVSISLESAKKIKEAKNKGKRIIAVGTTSCRAIESLAIKESNLIDDKKNIFFETDIYIYPGYQFKYTDALITNFHLPKSTLLLLVSALAGSDNIIKAYQEAINLKYRFFSYGDAMFIS